MTNIAVTGSRHCTDKAMVYQVLSNALNRHRDMHLIVGDAKGVDALAHEWAHENGVDHTSFAAEWSVYGKAAGPIRNREMMAHTDILLAFPGGRGTEDCIKAAKFLDIIVKRVS